MAELRFDPINRHTVIIAPERSKRPKDDFISTEEVSKTCPFCPGNEDQTPPEKFNNRDKVKNWTIRSFPNKYPAFTQSPYGEISGIQDVIVDSDKHDINPGDFSLEHLKELLKVYKERIESIKINKNIKYILVFKNHGLMAGATLEHPHSQIVGLTFVPHAVKKSWQRLKKFYSQNNQCYYCSLIDKTDIVFENGSFVLISPKEARFSYETWILPRTHQVHYEEITDQQLNDLSEIFSKLIKTLNVMLNKPAFNVILNSGLYDENSDHFYHWNIQILPRISYQAGFECGTGMFINQVEPENAARELKKNAL